MVRVRPVGCSQSAQLFDRPRLAWGVVRCAAHQPQETMGLGIVIASVKVEPKAASCRLLEPVVGRPEPDRG